MSLWASYPGRPIASLSSLSRTLDVPVCKLCALSEAADRLYKEIPKKKRDGSPRIVHDAVPALKDVHDRILRRILHKVSFPIYLQGGIKDIRSPRGYVSNANMHVGAMVVISEDVRDFFPSTTRSVIFDVWLRFFRFTPDVADCLTKLTTLNGALPQGAKTSNHLANLVFWDVEPQLVEALSERGCRYSRLTDDITVSTGRELASSEKTEIVRLVYGMLRAKGFRPKRRKHSIDQRGDRMSVNRLVVNGGKARLSKEVRNQIRAAVFQCEQYARACGRQHPDFISLYKSVSGKVSRLKQFGHPEYERLRGRLLAIAPLLPGEAEPS